MKSENIKLPTNQIILGLTEHSLGLFVKLLVISNDMAVKGVLVNGHIISKAEIRERLAIDEPIFEESMSELIESGLVEIAEGGLLLIPFSNQYFYGTSYTDDDFAQVVGVIRKEIQEPDLARAISRIQDVATFVKKVDEEELRERLRITYAKFGEDRGKMISYISMFRSKRQIEMDMKLATLKHMAIVTSLLDMYSSNRAKSKGVDFAFTRERFIGAIDYMVARKMHSLKNHNYLKIVLQNQSVATSRGANDGSKRTNEGYN
ncbi:MAG: hypothetical protein V1799_07915 [bacterium]